MLGKQYLVRQTCAVTSFFLLRLYGKHIGLFHSQNHTYIILLNTDQLHENGIGSQRETPLMSRPIRLA